MKWIIRYIENETFVKRCFFGTFDELYRYLWTLSDTNFEYYIHKEDIVFSIKLA